MKPAIIFAVSLFVVVVVAVFFDRLTSRRTKRAMAERLRQATERKATIIPVSGPETYRRETVRPPAPPRRSSSPSRSRDDGSTTHLYGGMYGATSSSSDCGSSSSYDSGSSSSGGDSGGGGGCD